MSQWIGGLYLVALIALMFYWILFKRTPADSDQTQDDDFSYLTIREQLAAAQETSDALGEAEQLITDMAESDEDDIMVLHLEWIGRDNAAHEMSLYCDGVNTASECMTAIADRAVCELRQTLSRQCRMLKTAGRHRPNGRQNGSAAAGEEDDPDDETLSMLRHGHQHG